MGLSIRHVGDHVASVLAKRMKSLEAIANASEEELNAIDEVGPTIASSIHAWFADERNRKLVRRLVEAGVSTRAEEDGQPEVPQVLAGKSVVLTGALESRSREQAARAVEERGGRVASSVSKKTDFVVVGTDPGSKAERARELGVTMVDEAGFQRLLEKGEAV